MVAGRDGESAPRSVPKVDDPGEPQSLAQDSEHSVQVQEVSAREQESQGKGTEKVVHVEESVVHVDVLAAIPELGVRDPQILFPDPVRHHSHQQSE